MVRDNAGADLQGQIAGTTLQVHTYLFLHPGNGAGVREVQCALGFRSPSSAIFQLEKLRLRGLAEKRRSGEYYLLSRPKIGVLRDFVEIRGRLLPRLLFHSLLVSVVATTLAILFIRFGTIETVLAVIPSLLAAITLWIETQRIWKERTLLYADARRQQRRANLAERHQEKPSPHRQLVLLACRRPSHLVGGEFLSTKAKEMHESRSRAIAAQAQKPLTRVLSEARRG